MLALSLKTLPLGTAYAVWTGIGAVGAVTYGIVAMGESRDLLKILFVMMILGGIVGLRATAGKTSASAKAEQGQAIGSKTETGDHPGGAR